MKPLPLYLPIREFCKLYKWPTEHGMRNYIKKRKENGFKNAFVWSGRRVLIDVNEFWDCIERKKEK